MRRARIRIDGRRSRRAPGWRLGLHLLVALALALSAVAPPRAVVASDAAPVVFALDANGFPICHVPPAPDEGDTVRPDGHCQACVLVGPVSAIAPLQPVEPLPSLRGTTAWAAPEPVMPRTAAGSSPSARGPPVPS